MLALGNLVQRTLPTFPTAGLALTGEALQNLRAVQRGVSRKGSFGSVYFFADPPAVPLILRAIAAWEDVPHVRNFRVMGKVKELNQDVDRLLRRGEEPVPGVIISCAEFLLRKDNPGPQFSQGQSIVSPFSQLNFSRDVLDQSIRGPLIMIFPASAAPAIMNHGGDLWDTRDFSRDIYTREIPESDRWEPPEVPPVILDLTELGGGLRAVEFYLSNLNLEEDNGAYSDYGLALGPILHLMRLLVCFPFAKLGKILKSTVQAIDGQPEPELAPEVLKWATEVFLRSASDAQQARSFVDRFQRYRASASAEGAEEKDIACQMERIILGKSVLTWFATRNSRSLFSLSPERYHQLMEIRDAGQRHLEAMIEDFSKSDPSLGG